VVLLILPRSLIERRLVLFHERFQPEGLQDDGTGRDRSGPFPNAAVTARAPGPQPEIAKLV
jgi:hypothetical protein